MYYKKKGNGVGFCKKNIKIVRGSSLEGCFINKTDTFNVVNNIKDNNHSYKKITIRNGKKIYTKD